MATRNTAWVITASAPLLRPGMSVSITVSEKYVVEETLKLLAKVREINIAAQQPLAPDAGQTPIKGHSTSYGGAWWFCKECHDCANYQDLVKCKNCQAPRPENPLWLA